VEATSAPRAHGLRIPRPRRLLSALPDERLVEHVRHGEAAAFEILYDRYSAGILGFCRHMLGSDADAEDAAQHTFIAAHADIQRHERRELHVKAWLYTIARNRCVSMLRARREHASEDALGLTSHSPLNDIQQREDLRALLADVAKLPADQREALVLAEIGDLSHGEIASVLGCEVSKVKSLVFQARTALIDRRIARETPCEEIREQLATLRGGALRRSHLRHHLEACPGCSEYREQIRRQRAMLAVALPVIPPAALKANVLGGIGVGAGSAAVAATGAGAGATSGISAAGGLGAVAQGGLAKVGIAAVLAVGGAGGAAVATHSHLPLVNGSTSQSDPRGSQAPAAPGTAASTTPATNAAPTTHGQAATKHNVAGSRRSAKGTEHGFTPVTGESNGSRARDFAKTRGKGEETSAARRHVTKTNRAKRAKPVHVKRVKAPRAKVPNRVEAPKQTERTTRTRTQPEPKTTTEPAPQVEPTTTTPTPDAGGAPGTGTGKSGTRKATPTVG
jgi:RNA polymerase sigma factor (sigma-70 family)